MPCRDYDDNGNWEASRLREQNDRLARLLCRVCSQLDAQRKPILNDEVRDWWAKHKEADRKAAENAQRRRVAADQKALALSKLTEAEKKLLGIK